MQLRAIQSHCPRLAAPSLGSPIITSGASNPISCYINPSTLRGPIKLFDLPQLYEPIKITGLNKVVSVISILYMKKQSIPPPVVQISRRSVMFKAFLTPSSQA